MNYAEQADEWAKTHEGWEEVKEPMTAPIKEMGMYTHWRNKLYIWRGAQNGKQAARDVSVQS